jgi:AraC-like DNA-binding protein
MSNTRQDSPAANELIALSPNQLLTRVFELQKEEHDQPHNHPWHQLLLPRAGMLRTRTPTDIYFVPSNRAALIPAGVIHESWALTPARFAGIYFEPSLYPAPLGQCRIIEVTGFLDALIHQTLEIGRVIDRPHNHQEKRILAVLMDQVAASPVVDLSITVPDEKRLLPIVRELLTTPATATSLASWAKTVGASERTISRLFQKHTGLSCPLATESPHGQRPFDAGGRSGDPEYCAECGLQLGIGVHLLIQTGIWSYAATILLAQAALPGVNV